MCSLPSTCVLTFTVVFVITNPTEIVPFLFTGLARLDFTSDIRSHVPTLPRHITIVEDDLLVGPEQLLQILSKQFSICALPSFAYDESNGSTFAQVHLQLFKVILNLLL